MPVPIRIQLTLLLLGLTLLSRPALAGDDGSPEVARPPALRRLVETALEKNPRLLAARSRVEMLEQRAKQEGAWDDPAFGVDIERTSTKFNDYHDAEFSLSQRAPLTGKNRLKERIGYFEAGLAEQELRRSELDMAARVESAWYQLAGLDARLQENASASDILEKLRDVQDARAQTEAKLQPGLARVQMEIAMLKEQRATLAELRESTMAELNSLLNREGDAPLAEVEAATAANLTALPEHEKADTWQAIALQSRPEIQAADLQAQGADLALTLARRERLPDPEFRVEARRLDGERGIHEYDTGIFFTLPWANPGKYRAKEQERDAGLEMARQEAAAARLETRGLVGVALAEVRAARHHAEIYDTEIIPAAQRSLDLLRAGYDSSQTDIQDVLMAGSTLRDAQAQHWERLAAYWKARAQLKALTGAEEVSVKP